jgi:DNA end-binding protein Ku
MPRSLWNGTISFANVRVPVKLYSATESKAIRFRERRLSDGSAIEHRRVCVKEDREVPYSEIVKGFEVSAGSFVTLSKEEIAAADGPAARTVEIEHFVGREEIDPVYYERAYHLGPGKLGDESYRLLHAAMKRTERVAIGRFVFHNKAHLVAVRALDDVLALHTMRFADELVDPRELDYKTPERKPSKREVSAARVLVEQLGARFQPDRYRDTYRQAVLELIERKARGETIAPVKDEPATAEDDLFEALQASLDRHGPGSKTGGGGARSKKGAGASSKPGSSSPRVRAGSRAGSGD